MGSKPEVVRLARRQICRCMRGRPPDVRARMPFDSDDPDDIEVWIERRLRQHKWPDTATVAFKVQWLLWQAKKDCRRKSIGCGSLDDGEPESARAHCAPDSPRSITCKNNDALEYEAVDELAACAMAAIGNSFDLNGEHTERTATAALSCIARLVHAVGAVSSPSALGNFIEAVFNHRLYQSLKLPLRTRERFRIAIARLRSNDNMRRDLKKSRWPCPGNDQWNAFKQALMAELKDRVFQILILQRRIKRE